MKKLSRKVSTIIISYILCHYATYGQELRALFVDPGVALGNSAADGVYEYFEVTGSGGLSLSGKCLLAIDGNGVTKGEVTTKIDLSALSLGSNGLLLYTNLDAWTISRSAATTFFQTGVFGPLPLVNNTSTFLLMDCPTQNVGDDLDTNNDGTLDENPFNGLTVNEAVGYLDGDAGDITYSAAFSGSTVPVRPTTTNDKAEFLFKEGGVWYGGNVVRVVTGGQSTLDIEAAWSSSGANAPVFVGLGLGAGYTNAPLPVTITSFSHRTVGQEVILNWQTSDEVNFSHFVVERSRDARNFEGMASINAKKKFEESQKTYEFIDSSPKFGLNYYRLKQIDIDGTFRYSRIIAAEMTETSPILLYPNPVHDLVHIKNGEQEDLVNYAILNATGSNLKIGEFDDLEIKTSSLPAGSYILRLNKRDGSSVNRRFIKL